MKWVSISIGIIALIFIFILTPLQFINSLKNPNSFDSYDYLYTLSLSVILIFISYLIYYTDNLRNIKKKKVKKKKKTKKL